MGVDHAPTLEQADRRERDPDEIEGGGERLQVEVPDRDDPLVVARDHERVSLMRVQLDGARPGPTE